LLIVYTKIGKTENLVCCSVHIHIR